MKMHLQAGSDAVGDLLNGSGVLLVASLLGAERNSLVESVLLRSTSVLTRGGHFENLGWCWCRCWCYRKEVSKRCLVWVDEKEPDEDSVYIFFKAILDSKSLAGTSAQAALLRQPHCSTQDGSARCSHSLRPRKWTLRVKVSMRQCGGPI